MLPPVEAPTTDTVSQIVALVALVSWGGRKLGVSLGKLVEFVLKIGPALDRAVPAIEHLETEVKAGRKIFEDLLERLERADARADRTERAVEEIRATVSGNTLRLKALEEDFED